VELARFLAERGVEILSTGGTAAHLTGAGIDVIPVTEYAGSPEILGGRVKTLTPRIFGGILFDRDVEQHRSDVTSHDIPPIDLVVVNLYPFEETVRREGTTLSEAVEQIDIGGPSMLRAAAKNHRHVLPLCTPSLYEPFMEETSSGALSDELRKRAAVEVFRRTSAYDQAIADYLASESGSGGLEALPEVMALYIRKGQDLRYGENPQQNAAFYLPAELEDSFEQIQGKELSYNNILDLDGAWRIATSFDRPAAALIKHTNPCGAGVAAGVAEAFELALEADPVSAFGGILAVNRELDAATVEKIGKLFLEVIVAPSFSAEAREMLASKKNLRLVVPTHLEQEIEIRSAAGGFLIQSRDHFAEDEKWEVVTERTPSEEEMEALAFAWRLSAHVKSNAIVLARRNQSVGIGAGQMSRVDAAELAIRKSLLGTEGTAAASDAFFPFPDGVEVLASAGVRAVVQPGGSIRDNDVVDAANRLGLAMVMTGYRHFRH
jgi:phosphoribosylaminoimidazolecarboxamide formyltransferase / IMP cyclohydrolase